MDSFTYKANDGKADSNPGTVEITVNPLNHAPVVNNQSVTTSVDKPADITLTASDAEINDTLRADNSLTAIKWQVKRYQSEYRYSNIHS